MVDYKERYRTWLADPGFDQKTKDELLAIADDDKEIMERFYTDLSFGTAGLRGIVGAGTNRINFYTVRRATQGLANYIIKEGKQDMGVAISFDSRNMSAEFAEQTALCLAANGVKAYLFESLRPTPVLSFAVRELGCTAGVNITASHNPPEYNGYKVYWADGAQISPPQDAGIMAEVKAVENFSAAKTMDLKEARSQGLVEIIGKEIDDRYIAELKKLIKRPEAIKQMGDQIRIVYSPLHGTGNLPVRRILSEIGFQNVYVVPEQELPDGNFPTVSYPNPEDKEAFQLALKLAREKDADLVLATDPDADRLGVYVKTGVDGEYIALTGNMSGCLLADYEIGQRKELSGLPEDGALVKTIVSSHLADAIASYYGIELIEVLTGFKFIGRTILNFENSGKGTYLFGFEESYGCLIGTYARDKDAVSATMALCEAAAYYKTKNMTLWDAMLNLYERVGYHLDNVKAITLKGMDGLKQIQNIMQGLRENTPSEFGPYQVLRVRDYKAGTIKDLKSGEESTTGLLPSDVMYFELSDQTWVCVRPSGTEPKVKLYYGVVGSSLEDARQKSDQAGEALSEVIMGML